MNAPDPPALKQRVREYWDAESCGEVYATGVDSRSRLEALRGARYALEPYIAEFAGFADGKDRDVLEIGVGMGSDHLRWADSGPRRLVGVDLTDRAIEFTREHLSLNGRSSELRRADAESLPFDEASFDIVYAWGVIHHSPDTRAAVAEIHRVLRPGGAARIMIYHSPSMTGLMLWARYALLAGRPWRSLRSIHAEHLESPGTKAYTVRDARPLFDRFAETDIRVRLNHGDLLLGAVGQRHRGPLLRVAKSLWPRWLIRKFCGGLGLYLLIMAKK